ncbi:MAG: PEP-CTERM sorting domain-containing protein, partial [Verrucomicrobia bacterium]|nr:PEP-CTERM sorting domain-containing protein [Verrucomicrobiota bacterium]
SGNWRFDEVNISGNVVPEPGTYAWLSVGLIGLAGLARCRRKVGI